MSTRLTGNEPTDAISSAMVRASGDVYDHDRAIATTYINDNAVVCILEDILSTGEDSQIADGGNPNVIDERVAFQTGAQDEFTAAIERLAERPVTSRFRRW